MYQVFWQLLGGTSEWSEKVLGSVSAYRTDDPAKSLPRCTTRKGRVNMSYVLQQRVSDVNQDAALVVYFNVPPLECCKCISSKVPRSYCPSMWSLASSDLPLFFRIRSSI